MAKIWLSNIRNNDTIIEGLTKFPGVSKFELFQNVDQVAIGDYWHFIPLNVDLKVTCDDQYYDRVIAFLAPLKGTLIEGEI